MRRSSNSGVGHWPGRVRPASLRSAAVSYGARTGSHWQSEAQRDRSRRGHHLPCAAMDDSPMVRSASLWGDDHTNLGDIAVIGVGERTAVALSRGRYPKGYRHLDPNEDAVLAAAQGSKTLLVVADGHRGFDAARAAVSAVEDRVPQLLSHRQEAAAVVLDAMEAARQSVCEALASVEPERSGSRTTLAIALLTGSALTIAGLGDSRIAIIRPGGSQSFWGDAPFLGPDTNLDGAWFFTVDVEVGDWVIAGTDGLFDFLGRNGLRQLEALAEENGSADLARAAVESAFAGGAGDNVAVAVAHI